jgi:hypothetical protein
MMNSTTLSTLALGALLVSTAAAQSRLVGIDTGGANLYDIDPATGVRTLVGPVSGGVGTVGALAYDRTTGTLFLSSTSLDSLWTLDATTLVATLVGDYNVGATVVMHGIAVNPTTGVMYGKSTNVAGGGDFYTIDKTTGQATAVSSAGFGGFGGLEWIGNTLYISDTVGDSLNTIDPVTGVATLIGPYGFAASIGIGLAHDSVLGLLATDNITDSLYSLDVLTGAATLIGPHGAGNIISLEFIPTGGGSLGTNYCMANPNSTGSTGVIRAVGSASVAANDVTLEARALPNNAFGFFLTSLAQGFVANAGGSQGNLCLGGSIGRYVGPGQVQNTGMVGGFSLVLDLTQTPTPVGFVAIQAGETWNFQAWHRDAVGGVATSNFTDGLEVLFN